MHFVIDILLLGLLAFLLFRGWKRGFSASVLKCGRLILSFVITFSLGSSFSSWLEKRWVYPAVFSRIQARFSEIALSADGHMDRFLSQIPAVFRPYLDPALADPTHSIDRLADEWSVAVSEGISGVLASVFGHILLFILVYALLSVVIFFLRSLTKLPVVHTVDSVLGLILGGAGGLLLVAFLSAVIGAVLEIMGQIDTLEQSLTLRIFEGVREALFQA